MKPATRAEAPPPGSCSPAATAPHREATTPAPGGATCTPASLRERITEHGPGALSDLELMALIVGRGAAGRGTVAALSRLAERAELAGLQLLDCRCLMESAGLTVTQAAVLSAAFEMGRRLCRPEVGPGALCQASDVHRVVRDLELARREHFVAFYLDTRNRILARETISVGSLSASIVHPREVFAPAIERRAASVILAHNHPSGDPEPSGDDVALTRRLVQAGLIIGIEVLDHLVIGHGHYVSLKTRGLL